MAEDPTPAPDAIPSDPPAPSNAPPSNEPPTVSKPTAPPSVSPAASPEPPEPVVEPDWRTDWREKFAGKNPDDLKKLGRYKSPDGIWKAYKSLEQRMSAGEYTRNKPEGATDEKMAEWRKEVGVPESPEGYYASLPEEVKIPEADKPWIDTLFKEMHGIDATPEMVVRGVETYYRMGAVNDEAMANKDAEQKRATEDELRAEWGPEYRQNWNHFQQVLFDTDIFVQAPEGLKEKFETARFKDGTSLMNDPDAIRWMVDAARTINPDIGHSITPPQGKTMVATVSARIKELESMTADTKGEYWTGPDAGALQAELRGLYDLEERQQRRSA